MRDTSEQRANEDAQERLDDDGAPARPQPDAPRARLVIEPLELGPEPLTRSCPHCRAIVMRDATRCGHCWNYLRQ